MQSFLLIEFAVLSTFCALIRQDNSARQPVLARRTTSYLFWKSQEYSARRAIGPRAFVPRANKSAHLNWEMLAIWIYLGVSFAAFFVASYIIWAKCHGG